MTRLTKHTRDAVVRDIMAGLPVIDYAAQIHALVQRVVIDHAPEYVKALYADENTRGYLQETELEVRKGNASVQLWSTPGTRRVFGVCGSLLRIQMMDDSTRLHEGSLYRDVLEQLRNSTLVDKFFEQEDLHNTVKRRVRANVQAASTFKQLYTILEPELHHFIPKDEVKAQLPACVTQVVSDLRKLGAVLPDVPKAKS